MAGVLRGEGVCVGAADGVVVAASVLAEVGRVSLFPWLGVQTAVGTLGHVVLAQEVNVVKVAGVIGTVGSGMALVVCSVGLAGTRALTSIINTGEVLLSDVAVGRVDCSAHRGGAGETGLWIRSVVLGVAVRASNHDLELPTPLPFVLRRLRRHRRTPKRALDVGERIRLRACFGRSQGRVTLKVDVEGAA